MVAVPLGTKAYRRSGLPEVRCVNMYLEKDDSGVSPDGKVRIQRPGMIRVRDYGSTIRALDYKADTGETLVVSGTRLFANGQSVGTVTPGGIAPTVSTTFAYVILAGQQPYVYVTNPVAPATRLQTVAMPDGRKVQDVDQLNQYALFLCPDGRFYWSVPGKVTIDPLNFATAESSSDPGVAIRRVGDEFWIFGTKSVEPWQSTGNADAPFQRVSGRIYERGCLSRDTVRRFDNTVMWVSDDNQVCRGGQVPQVVSDNAIAERIRLRGGDLSAWVFGLDGHEFYVLTIPGQGTFAYDALTQAWCEFATFGDDCWRAYLGFVRNGVVTVGDRRQGLVWTLDGTVESDDDTLMERVLTATLPFVGNAARNNDASVIVGSDRDVTMRLRWRDGQDDYPDYADEFAARAPFDVAQVYRLGQPLQPYRSYEVSCREPAILRVFGMTVGDNRA